MDFINNKISQVEYNRLKDIADDLGRFAVLNNYDAIHVEGVHFTILLNRSILAVEDKDV